MRYQQNQDEGGGVFLYSQVETMDMSEKISKTLVRTALANAGLYFKFLRSGSVLYESCFYVVLIALCILYCKDVPVPV
jgi:hypothetical protein